MADPTLELRMILPEAALPARPVRGLDLPAADGRMTVLANHQPLIAALKAGTAVVTTATGERETWEISAGAVRVAGNTATLLLAYAKPMEASSRGPRGRRPAS